MWSSKLDVVLLTSVSFIILQLYLAHLKAVVDTNFPANLYSVFDMVLQGKPHWVCWQTQLFGFCTIVAEAKGSL